MPNVSGGQNTCVGVNTLNAIGASSWNTAVGAFSANSSSVCQYNTSVGGASMYYNTTGSYNTAIGVNASRNNTTSGNNCAVGVSALYNSTGGNNCAIGYGSGITNTSGNNNTYLGTSADGLTSGLSNSTAVGFNSRVSVSNQIVLGTTTEFVNIPSTTTSTTTSTGALTISGGVGIGGNVNIGGKVVIQEAVGTDAGANSGSLVIRHNNTNGFSSISFPSTNNNGSDYAYIKYQDDITNSGSERSRLIIGVENDATGNFNDNIILYSCGGSGNVGINNLNPAYILDVNGTFNVSSTSNFVGITSITNSTSSTSTSTGALVITGGVGIGGNVNIGGNLNVSSTTASFGSSSGALLISGGIGLGESINGIISTPTRAVFYNIITLQVYSYTYDNFLLKDTANNVILMTDAIIGTTYTLLTYYITYSGSLYANIISQVPGTAGLCNGAYNSVSNPTVYAYTIVKIGGLEYLSWNHTFTLTAGTPKKLYLYGLTATGVPVNPTTQFALISIETAPNNISTSIIGSINISGRLNISASTQTNTNLGYLSLPIVQGGFNSVFGYKSYQNINDGSSNVGLGAFVGSSIVSGNFNTFLGSYAGSNSVYTGGVSGNNNVLIGSYAGYDSVGTIGSNNTFLGSKTSASGGCNNATAIGANSVAFGSYQVVLGTSSDTVHMRGAVNLNTQTVTATTTLTNPLPPMVFVDNGATAITITLPSAGTGAFLYIRRMAGSTGAVSVLHSSIFDLNSVTATTSVGLGTGKTFICRFTSWFVM